MKFKLGGILLVLLTALGCTSTARLYPVQGPLSTQTPLPVLTGKVTAGTHSGNVAVVMSDGERCKGRWTAVRPVQASKGAPAASLQTASGMSSAWDTVYGTGFYVSHVLGASMYVQAMISGDRGTIINLEMYQPEGERVGTGGRTIRGVAKDSKGNIYKIAVD